MLNMDEYGMLKWFSPIVPAVSEPNLFEHFWPYPH